jgi:very-short-patch-repair endonuclease
VLEAQGYRVVRFTNDEVISSTQTVLDRIKWLLLPLPQSPFPLGRGGA